MLRALYPDAHEVERLPDRSPVRIDALDSETLAGSDWLIPPLAPVDNLAVQLLAGVAGATIVAYTLYTVTARDSIALVATVPFVVFGLARYLQLLHRHAAGEEPENVLLGDAAILVTVATWAAACAAILVLTVIQLAIGRRTVHYSS